MAEGEQDDLELLKAWHTGSTMAGNTLYRRHEAPLRRFFVSKAPPQDTDELVQQTWMAMTRNQNLRRRFSCDENSIRTDANRSYW